MVTERISENSTYRFSHYILVLSKLLYLVGVCCYICSEDGSILARRMLSYFLGVGFYTRSEYASIFRESFCVHLKYDVILA